MFSKVAGYNVLTKKYIVCLHTSNVNCKLNVINYTFTVALNNEILRMVYILKNMYSIYI